MGGTGPEGHGLARFNSDLTDDWLYPRNSGLPSITDCYSLNVAGETACFSPCTQFHILSATGTEVTGWGPSPHRYAHHLLRCGPDLALIGGSGPEYDVATMLRITRDSQPQAGAHTLHALVEIPGADHNDRTVLDCHRLVDAVVSLADRVAAAADDGEQQR